MFCSTIQRPEKHISERPVSWFLSIPPLDTPFLLPYNEIIKHFLKYFTIYLNKGGNTT